MTELHSEASQHVNKQDADAVIVKSTEIHEVQCANHLFLCFFLFIFSVSCSL